MGSETVSGVVTDLISGSKQHNPAGNVDADGRVKAADPWKPWIESEQFKCQVAISGPNIYLIHRAFDVELEYSAFHYRTWRSDLILAAPAFLLHMCRDAQHTPLVVASAGDLISPS